MSRLSSFPSIRRAAGPAIVMAGALGLAACGQSASPAADSAPEAPKAPAPTEAEKLAMLAALPAP